MSLFACGERTVTDAAFADALFEKLDANQTDIAFRKKAKETAELHILSCRNLF